MRLRGMTLLDCQQESAHVMAQGGQLLARTDFEERLGMALAYLRDAGDALTQEYASTPEAGKHLWPFLPWRKGYVWQDDAWQEQDS